MSILRVTLPPPPATGSKGLHQLVEGLDVARRDRVVGQCLITIGIFSFLCLPFITQMPKIAGDHLAIDPRSSAYGFLYSCFGMGAVFGALSIGTIFAGSSKAKVTRVAMVCFAVMVVIFGNLELAGPAYAAVLILGCVYFAVITSLSTVLQQDLDDAVRGKVMALWIMGFGGVVPFGGLLGGWFMEQVGIRPVIFLSAAIALALAATMDFKPAAADTEPERAVATAD